MNFTRLEAKPVVSKLHLNISAAKKIFESKKGRAPTLATILVGNDPASEVYVSNKAKSCHKLGLGHRDFTLSRDTTEQKLLELISTLNNDDTIDGILVQSPLPAHIHAIKIYDHISPQKDVDCFHPLNVGLLSQGRAQLRPCTPSGVIEILKFYKTPLAGANALVVGRSDIVGKPMAMLLTAENATVTLAHSKTKDLQKLCAAADIVVAAIGKPKFFNSSFSWRPTATIIDIGIHRIDGTKLCGDVDFETVSQKVAAITPVPGGVGPLTIAMLMVNTVRAAFNRSGLPLEKSGL